MANKISNCVIFNKIIKNNFDIR